MTTPTEQPSAWSAEWFAEREKNDLFTIQNRLNAELDRRGIVSGDTRTNAEQPALSALADEFDWRKAAINLAVREADYRLNHDVHGDGSREAGRSWDRMRHAGDAVRAAAFRQPQAARPEVVEALIAAAEREGFLSVEQIREVAALSEHPRDPLSELQRLGQEHDAAPKYTLEEYVADACRVDADEPPHRPASNDPGLEGPPANSPKIKQPRASDVVEALGKAVVFSAYRASDPLAIRFEFANDEDRVAAADAVDQAFLLGAHGIRAALSQEQGK